MCPLEPTSVSRPLRSVAGNMRLTTAKFFSPNGREMAGAGVTPDLPVRVGDTLDRYTTNDLDIRQAMRAASSPELKELANTGYRNSRPRSSQLEG